MSKDFGPFEMIKKIGGGGMASVHLAVQKSLDRQVVLKILYPHLAEDEKLVARFEREARAAAMMRHENIVQVIDCGVYADQPYIAMEFVEGLDLKAWMELHGAPPLEMALLMLRDICRGLEHAHGLRIVHRDIKPANVMMTSDGTIKIMDFGLARRGAETTAVTVMGSVLGTPAYMSPEQASGTAVDERADIFSTGVVAYELLGGRRPFQGDSYSSVLHEILNVNPPPLETLNPTVPRAVVGIIHRMLQKDVKRRYQKIAEVRGDLETVIEEMALTRGKDLLHEYVRDPERVRDVLLGRRLTRALERGRAYESLGPEKVGEALHEFRCALYVDPGNAEAKGRVKHLEREWKRLEAEREKAQPADATMILDPEQAAAIDAAPTPPRGVTAAPRPPAARAERPSSFSTPVPRHEPHRPPTVQRTRMLLIASSGALLLVVVAVLGVWMWSRTKGGDGPPPASGQTATPAPAPSTLPTPAPRAAEVASLEVISQPPGARIVIDGVAQPQTTNTIVPGLAPGRHEVEVSRDQYGPQRRAVEVRAGAQNRVRFALASPAEKPETSNEPGTLIITVKPFASFYVDDALRESDRSTATIALAPGKHRVRAVHPKLGSIEWTVNITSGRVTTVTQDLLATATGSLRISIPGGGWAYVFLDGSKLDKTAPCVVDEVKAGSHTVELRREGFAIQGSPKTVTVMAGKTVDLSFKVSQAP